MTGLISIAGGGAVSAYTIDNSVRLAQVPRTDGSSPSYFKRLEDAWGNSGNLKTWTISWWMKHDVNVDNTERWIYWVDGDNAPGSMGYDVIYLINDQLSYYCYVNGWSTQVCLIKLNRKFRDASAWYHCMVVMDSTLATAADRLKIYVNGVRETSFATDTQIAQNADTNTDMNANTYVGTSHSVTTTQSYGGYFAEFCRIDGQALGPENFGELDSDTNQWIPIDVSDLTFGAEGFHLEFQDAAALGDDSSGSSNDFTPTNLVVTDQMTDTPTNNFCTLNPLDTNDNGSWNGEIQEGDLKLSGTAGVVKSRASFALDTTNGSYWEVRWGSATDANCGISKLTQKNLTTSSQIGADPAYDETGYKGSTGVIDTDGSTEATYATSAEGTIVAFAYKAGRLYVGKVASASAAPTWFNSGNPANGTGYVNSSVKTDPDYWAAACGLSHTVNFGQDSSFGGEETAQANTDANNVGEFWGSVPTGYLALCNSNLPDPSIKLPGENFNTVLYTGNGGNDYAITGVGFQPDFVWNKDLASNYHGWWDAIRGVDSRIYSNNTDAANTGTDAFESFDSDGFSLNSNSTWNANTNSYVSWNWLAATTFDPKTDGDIAAASGQSNATAGFSIVKYTGESGSPTVGHGLSVAPEIIIIKNLEDTKEWNVAAPDFISTTKRLVLNTTAAQAVGSGLVSPYINSTIFKLDNGTTRTNDGASDYIVYCFHSVEGYSKVGSYVGNGNAVGPFVYTGFRPAYLMTKQFSTTGSWTIHDNKRDIDNVMYRELIANGIDADHTSDADLDFTSNGFKIRRASGQFNTNNATIIYLAFAKCPFKYANAR